MAVKLIYQMFAKLLSWMVLHARSDTQFKVVGSMTAVRRAEGVDAPFCDVGEVLVGPLVEPDQCDPIGIDGVR